MSVKPIKTTLPRLAKEDCYLLLTFIGSQKKITVTFYNHVLRYEDEHNNIITALALDRLLQSPERTALAVHDEGRHKVGTLINFEYHGNSYPGVII